MPINLHSTYSFAWRFSRPANWACFITIHHYQARLAPKNAKSWSEFGRWNATISHFMKCLTPPFFRSWDDAFQSHSQRKQPFRMYMWSLSILLRNKVKSTERISHDFPYIFSIWGFSRFLFSFWEKGNLWSWDNILGTKIQSHHCPHKYRCMNRYLEKITDCWDSFV